MAVESQIWQHFCVLSFSMMLIEIVTCQISKNAGSIQDGG
jgi:hypothetical protein